MGDTMMRAGIRVLAIALAAGATVLSAPPGVSDAVEDPVSSPDTLEAIIKASSELYSQCDSYLDIGEVVTDYSSPRGEHTDRSWFSAAFLRGCCFSFEFRDEEEDLSVWRAEMLDTEEGSHRKWWDISTSEARDATFPISLVGAIGFTGGCGGVLMSSLLPDEVKGDGLGNFVSVDALPDGRIGDSECFRFEGTAPGTGAAMLVWIGKETLLLRRLEVDHEFRDIRTHTVVTFDASVDVEIDRRGIGSLTTRW
jgi:hypothetical protein